MAMFEQPIKETLIEKLGSEQRPILVKLLEYKNGKKFVDIRGWWIPDGQTELAPSKRGIRLTLEDAQKLTGKLNFE